jgi:UDP-glucose 4-epimerase
MARVLVTGGAGYVGSVCCGRLLARGHSVEVVDDLSTGFADAVPAGAVLHTIGIEDRDALSGVLTAGRFDTVFHFAAKASVPESVVNPGPFFDTNVASGIALLEGLREHGIRNLAFSSSAAVYGTPEVAAIPEGCTKEPVNPYGESKLMFEQVAKSYAIAYGWSVVAFRYFNACGGGADWGERHNPETHIIPLLLQAASGRRSFFEVFGTDYDTRDGTCLRDFVHVLDIAEAHLLAMRKMDKPGFCAYNIGTGKNHSVREICEFAERVSRRQIRIRTAPRRAGDPPVLCADPQKLIDELGWEPKHSSVENILAGAWEWEQQQCKELVIEGLKNSPSS